MSYDEEDLEKLAKYNIVKGILIISLIHRESKTFIYNFFHPMSRVEKSTLAEAEEINQEMDLFYGDIKLYKLEDDNEVLFYEGNKARLMAILKPETMRPETGELIEGVLERFLYEFEAKYAKILKEWNGDTTPFQECDAMLFNYLNVDLTYPHISKYRGFDPEEPIEQYIFHAADDFSRKIGYFYLDNLLYLTKQYVRDKAKEDGNDPNKVEFPPDEEFYLAMFKLKKVGMLAKIDNFKEDLNLYSKIQYQ
jgi:hypothetical protein